MPRVRGVPAGGDAVSSAAELKQMDIGMRRVNTMLVRAIGVLLAGAALHSAAAEPDADRRTETVAFAKGATSARTDGVLKGRQYVDYTVRAGAGQSLSVQLKAGNPQTYFNVMAPGANEAMFVGSTSGSHFKRALPVDGGYVVRVYLMRAAARRGESSRYALDFSLDGGALAPTSPDKDALIRGTQFHASTNVACTRSGNPQPLRCDANVIRRGFDGSGTVEVNWPDGLKRNILFVRLQPLASDSRESMTFTRKGDVTAVGIGSEGRVEIPDLLLTGG
jgi:hypothetical protein